MQEEVAVQNEHCAAGREGAHAGDQLLGTLLGGDGQDGPLCHVHHFFHAVHKDTDLLVVHVHDHDAGVLLGHFAQTQAQVDNGDDLAAQVNDAAHVSRHAGEGGNGVVGDDFHHLSGVEAVAQAVGQADEVFGGLALQGRGIIRLFGLGVGVQKHILLCGSHKKLSLLSGPQ